jgi:hypothetical protein
MRVRPGTHGGKPRVDVATGRFKQHSTKYMSSRGEEHGTGVDWRLRASDERWDPDAGLIDKEPGFLLIRSTDKTTDPPKNEAYAG